MCPRFRGTPYSTTAPYLITVNAGSPRQQHNCFDRCSGVYFLWHCPLRLPLLLRQQSDRTVQFVVNGAVYAIAALSSSGTAQAIFNLALGSYTISAVYSGDAVNLGFDIG